MTLRLFGVLAVLFATACANHPSTIGGRAPLGTHPETTMTKTAAKSTTPVTWFSLPADDIQKATAFYREAFGWEIEPLTQEEDHAYDYNVVVNSPSDGAYVPREPGRVNGCIVKRAIGLTTPAVLIEVRDLDEAAKKVVAAGGTVVSGEVPMRSLDGAFILVKDPDGNTLELFRSNAR